MLTSERQYSCFLRAVAPAGATLIFEILQNKPNPISGTAFCRIGLQRPVQNGMLGSQWFPIHNSTLSLKCLCISNCTGTSPS